METPFFSIIIPTFNAASHIEKTMNSVFFQRFLEIELIIVDGSSTDNTLDIVQGYSPEGIIIKCVSEKDKGIYDAMNKGVSLAKGAYLYFLGADDTLYDDKVLEEIHSFIIENPCDIVYGNVLSEAFDDVYDGEFTVEKIINKNICHQAIFFRKSIFEKIGLYDLKYKVLADWNHNLKWFFKDGVHHRFVDVIIANYGHDGYSSATKDTVFWDSFPRMLFNLGYRRLPVKKLISINRNIIKDHKENRRYVSYYMRKFTHYWLKLRTIFNT
jgi:glycosyltransferase involved in cell wall biosynthesis